MKVSPSRNVFVPLGHEVSRLASPREPDSVYKQWQRGNRRMDQRSSDAVAIKNLLRKIESTRRRILGGSGSSSGWDWMYPDHKELDTTLSYSAGKFVYISALNTLVTTGMTDVVSNATVTSCQGIWQALQDIPAASGGKFNVPTLNYPSGAQSIGGSVVAPGTTAPSGTPLIGDMDLVDATTGKKVRYWEYWGDISA